MYAILAEDNSDIECLKVLIKRIAKDNSIKIKGRGFSGCAKMLRDGWKDLEKLQNTGYDKFIICYDRDKDAYQKRYDAVVTKIIKRSGINKSKNKICILIPTEEIEAWILADIKAVSTVISSWKPTKEFPNPESIINPKEKLKKLSETKKSKPLYDHVTHNQRILEKVDLGIVKNKCPSFKVLADFIEHGTPNYPKK
ncbi:MAG: DUF4276 family protein [Methyloprofundus sp.]|nr:DUF4276 family protein [Methyloprofundus sp.]